MMENIPDTAQTTRVSGLFLPILEIFLLAFSVRVIECMRWDRIRPQIYGLVPICPKKMRDRMCAVRSRGGSVYETVEKNTVSWTHAAKEARI